MATSTYYKFDSFVKSVAEKKHNLSSDQLMVALTNTAPLATNSVLTDITEVAYTYLSSRVLTISSSTQTSGVYKLTLADLTLTSTGGATGPFRYVVIYNNTATNKELIGWYDNGSSTSIPDTGTLLIDLDQVNGILTIQ